MCKHDMQDFVKIRLLNRYFHQLKSVSISLKTERALEDKVNEKVEEIYSWLENNVRRVELCGTGCDQVISRR